MNSKQLRDQARYWKDPKAASLRRYQYKTAQEKREAAEQEWRHNFFLKWKRP